jgi:hypothetical protein
MGVGDPVRKLPGEYAGGDIPGINRIKPYCRGCLVVEGASYSSDPQLGAQLAEQLSAQDCPWPLIVLADDVDIADAQTPFLWTTFTRFNPAADLYAASEPGRHHIGYKLPIVIDARMKPGYPDELFPRKDIVELVDRRWKQYFQTSSWIG